MLNEGIIVRQTTTKNRVLHKRRRMILGILLLAVLCLGAAELAVRLEKKRMTREDLSAMLEGCREAFSAALLSLYGQQPEEIRRETVSFLAKNLTKSQIVRTIE